jgi:hypothetical protein
MAAASGRRRSRKATGGLAIGITSTLALGGLAAPAVAQEPAADAHCRADGGSSFYSVTIRDFPPDESFLFFASGRSETSTVVYQGNPITTDFSGFGSTPEVPGDPPTVHIAFAVYRDTNGNSRWDPDVDDTVYRGDGPVTSCPQTVTLTSK